MISDFTARGLAVSCWSPWLILHNVLLNVQNAGSVGKRTRLWVHRPNGSPIMPIQYGRPTYIGAYVRTKCMSQNLSRTCNRVVAYRDCLTHKPITAQHLVLPDASALPLGLAYREWLCDGGWTLGMGQWDVHIFPTLRSVPYSRTVNTGNLHAHKFHFGMINIRPLVPVP